MNDTAPEIAVRVVTYASDNAPAGYEAVAHLWLDGTRLPVVFSGVTLKAAEQAALAHWDEEMKKHAASIASRAEARRRAAETRARKASDVLASLQGAA